MSDKKKQRGYFDSPVGKLCIETEDDAVTALYLVKDGRLTEDSETRLLRQVKTELAEYFAGKRKIFDVPLKLEGTKFRMAVWKALREIPYGETRYYQEIGDIVGIPNAGRAVGQANHHNPIMILVPCHRVIGKNGSLTGFGGGLDVKEKLLELEKRNK